MDGTPLTQNQVQPGGTYLYKFTVTRPGLYWYHPHHHSSTNQVFKGLYGSIIVADPSEDELQAAGVLLGFRSGAHAAAAGLFQDPEVCTDDGSVGRRALVTELLREQFEQGESDAAVYACGPPPMLEAVRLLCAAHGVPAQLALESGMACGFGACFGCVVPTWDGYLRLCVDGPVLDAALLESAVFPGAGH
jgi:FtsP/CotA-like multicopper oxidase with cupredoxin domain